MKSKKSSTNLEMIPDERIERRRIIVRYCGNCKQELLGDGSLANPYSCQCGEWERDWNKPLVYHLKVKAL